MRSALEMIKAGRMELAADLPSLSETEFGWVAEASTLLIDENWDC